MMQKVYISEIKSKAKGDWFSKANTRFFRTELPLKGYRTDVGYWFVSSEQFDDKSPRKFSVRFMNGDGDVHTVGAFNELDKAGANSLMKAWMELPLPAKFWKLFNILETAIRKGDNDKIEYWIRETGVEFTWSVGEAPILMAGDKQLHWADHF